MGFSSIYDIAFLCDTIALSSLGSSYGRGVLSLREQHPHQSLSQLNEIHPPRSLVVLVEDFLLGRKNERLLLDLVCLILSSSMEDLVDRNGNRWWINCIRLILAPVLTRKFLMLIWNYDFHCIFLSSFSPTETTFTEIGSGSCHGQGLLHLTMSRDPLCRLLSYTQELSLSKPIGLSLKGVRREEGRPLL